MTKYLLNTSRYKLLIETLRLFEQNSKFILSVPRYQMKISFDNLYGKQNFIFVVFNKICRNKHFIPYHGKGVSFYLLFNQQFCISRFVEQFL